MTHYTRRHNPFSLPLVLVRATFCTHTLADDQLNFFTGNHIRINGQVISSPGLVQGLSVGGVMFE